MLFVGVDIGGSFTDFALYDSDTDEVAVHKVRSSPSDPERALVDGFIELCALAGVAADSVDGVLHGTTVATNAVLEHRGAVTGLVTTAGMRDVVHIGRHQRPQAYSVMQDIPWQSQPFVLREHRICVAERIAPPNGETLVALDEQAVRAAGATLRAAGVEAVAVCFLFSYLDPAHEARAAEILAEELPGCFISTSAGVSPQFREFERFTTACMNSFVGPGTATYLERLGEALRIRGVHSELLVMRSNGGVASVAEAAARPVTLMLSGPAAGVLGGQWTGGLVDHQRLITLDMGGTSTDIGLVTEAGVREASTRDTQIAGYPILVPMFDLQTIGAGGGSIARVDDGGALVVGPRSAGASPGPACYGLGGTEPTVTDANLVLGRLGADRFLGGEMRLDLAAARRALMERVAKPLDLDPTAAADGILRIAATKMSNVVRWVTTERGLDAADFALVAYGGAGPLHAAMVARELRIAKVVIPRAPGHFSAYGMLLADLRRDFVNTWFTPLAEASFAVLEERYAEMERRGRDAVERGYKGLAGITVRRGADMRYVGQEHAVFVELPSELFAAQETAVRAHCARPRRARGRRFLRHTCGLFRWLRLCGDSDL
jgi:N-methylhydantoinase A